MEFPIHQLDKSSWYIEWDCRVSTMRFPILIYKHHQVSNHCQSSLELFNNLKLTKKKSSHLCIFTRGQFWPSGIACVRVFVRVPQCASGCLSVCQPELVCAVNCHLFNLGTPKFAAPWLSSLLFWECRRKTSDTSDISDGWAQISDGRFKKII